MAVPDPLGRDVPGLADFVGGGAAAVAEIAADRLTRAVSRGDEALITVCVDCLARAVSTLPADHELRGKYMTYLVAGYRARFLLTGDAGDERAGIAWGQLAASAIPAGHPGRVVALFVLAEEYLRRFHRLGAIEDLKAAISAGELALSDADEDTRQSARGEILAVLGNAYWLRFQHSGSPADLAVSIEYGEASLTLLEADHQGRYHLLIGVATALLTQFQHDHQIETLRNGIARLDAALTQPGTPDNRGPALWAVATAYLEKFRLTGQLNDLQRCGLRTTEALVHTADHDRLSVGVHAADVATAFLSVESPDGIEQAILFGRVAAEHVPAGHPYQLVVLSNLSVAHRLRFEQFGDVDDIHKAIEFGAQAVRRTDNGVPHRVRAQVMRNLSLCFQRRFECGNDPADQRAAESFALLAAQSLSRDYPA